MIAVYHKIIQLHICLIYFVNGFSKISGHTWQDGSGMWDAINQPQFHSILTPLLQQIFMVKPLAIAMAWSAVIVEISFPFLIWIRKLNVLALIAILLLHVFIALVFGLWLFAFVMIMFNLSAFGHLLIRKRTV